MFKEFKEFALRGNVVDLAVAVVNRLRIQCYYNIPCQRYHHAAHRYYYRRT